MIIGKIVIQGITDKSVRELCKVARDLSKTTWQYLTTITALTKKWILGAMALVEWFWKMIVGPKRLETMTQV